MWPTVISQLMLPYVITFKFFFHYLDTTTPPPTVVSNNSFEDECNKIRLLLFFHWCSSFRHNSDLTKNQHTKKKRVKNLDRWSWKAIQFSSFQSPIPLSQQVGLFSGENNVPLMVHDVLSLKVACYLKYIKTLGFFFMKEYKVLYLVTTPA